MAFLRLIHTNLLKTAQSVTAAGFTAGRGPEGLTTDLKVQALRVPGTTATVVATFAQPVQVRAVVSAATNLTASGTMTVRLTSDTGGTTQVALSAPATPAPGGPAVCTTSAEFAYGKHSKLAVWLPTAPVCRRVEVTFSDPTNANGFLDIGNLLVGDYWQAPMMPTYGFATGWDYLGEDEQRNQGGDLVSMAKPSFDQCSLTLQMLSATDKRGLYAWLRQLPSSALALLALEVGGVVEHDALLYGRVRTGGGFALPYHNAHEVKLNVQGW